MEHDFEQLKTHAKNVRMSVPENDRVKTALMRHMASAPSSNAFEKIPFLFLNFTRMTIIKSVSWGVAALAVAFVGISSYAYASPSVTRGDALYSLKTAYERMGLRNADTNFERVQVYSKLALRRLEEAKVLAGELGTESVPAVVSFLNIPVAYAETTTDGFAINGVEAQFDETGTAYFLISTTGEVTALTEAAIEEAEEITDPTELQEALEVIDATQTTQVEGLAEVAAEVGTDGDEAVVDAVAVAIDETIEDSAEVDAALETVADAVEAGDAEVTIEIATATDASSEDADEEESVDGDAAKLTVAQETIATFKADLLASGVSEEEAQKLFDRVDAKLLKAQEALADGNVNKMQGLLKATKALTNNAKHFAKKVSDEEGGDEDGAEDAEAGTEDDEESVEDIDDEDADEEGVDDDATDVEDDEGTVDDEDTGSDAGEDTDETSSEADVEVEAEGDIESGNGNVNANAKASIDTNTGKETKGKSESKKKE